MLTPLDIQKKEFRRAFRGYNEEDVDSFLDRVAQDYENLLRENHELKERLAIADKQMGRYREIEEVLKNTMIIAQKNADELRQNTEKEIHLLMNQARIETERLSREAEQEAAAILQEAERRSAEMISSAETRVKQMMEEYHRLQREAQIFRMRFRSFITAQIKLLDAEEEDLPVMAEEEEEDSILETE